MSTNSESANEALPPSVSIIIPYKNGIGLLRSALQSIPPRPDVEIIVIDDGSDNHEAALLLQKEFPWVCFSSNDTGEHNAGAARNLGLRKAKGKWVLFVDSDDLIDYDAFLNALDFLARAGQYDCVFFKCDTFCETKKSTKTRHLNSNKAVDRFLNENTDDCLRYAHPSPGAKFIRRSLIEQHRIRFDSVVAANDVMFSLQVGFNARAVTALDRTLYYVRVRDGSLTSINTPDRSIARLDVCSRVNKFFMEKKIPGYHKVCLSYFIASGPFRLSRKKLKIYARWVATLFRVAAYRIRSKFFAFSNIT